MTYYKQIWINGVPQISDETTLEGVALKLKSTRNEIDQLAIAYERAQEALGNIMEKQKMASEHYKELKAKLVELAEDIDSDDDSEKE